MAEMCVAAVVLSLLLAFPAAAEICRVVDGHTLRCGAGFKERVRISGIDAPELFTPKCRAEKRRAERAKVRLDELVDGRDLLLRREGRDRFGHTLATIYAGGTDVGAALVYEGLARWWEGRQEPWC